MDGAGAAASSYNASRTQAVCGACPSTDGNSSNLQEMFSQLNLFALTRSTLLPQSVLVASYQSQLEG